MKKLISETKKDFESSSGRTPEYLAWHRLFKKELTKFLQENFKIKEINISKPNHFDASGFFSLDNGNMYYFSLSDLRGFKDSLLIRTAQSFKDYTGGNNQYARLNNEDSFSMDMRKIVNY